MKTKIIAHPEPVKYIIGAMGKELSKEPKGICEHTLDLRYWGNGSSKCLGCGKIIQA
jgi:hypothetical protein